MPETENEFQLAFSLNSVFGDDGYSQFIPDLSVLFKEEYYHIWLGRVDHFSTMNAIKVVGLLAGTQIQILWTFRSICIQALGLSIVLFKKRSGYTLVFWLGHHLGEVITAPLSPLIDCMPIMLGMNVHWLVWGLWVWILVQTYAHTFVFIAPLLLLISLRQALQLRAGTPAGQMGGHGAGNPNETWHWLQVGRAFAGIQSEPHFPSRCIRSKIITC